MTLREAVKRGISKVRDPGWACKDDYIQIDILPNPADPKSPHHGPWVHLYSPLNEVVGNPNPATMLCTMFDWNEDGWEEYKPEPTK